MALTLPYPTLGPGVVDEDQLNSNNTTFASKFGNIDNADIKALAGILTSKLAADNYEIVLSTSLHGTEINTNAGTASYYVVGSIPYDTTNTTYTVSAIDTMSYAAAARTAAVFTLFYGTAAQYIAGTATTIKAGISTGAGAATFTGTAISSFTTSITTSSTAPSYFILDVTTTGVSWAANDSFGISIKLKKALRT
jgi:hypothetical protein